MSRALGLDIEDDRTWVRVSDNLVLHKPSGVYYARKSKAGKGRFFKSTGITQKGRAQSMADEMIAQWIGGKRHATGRIQRVSEAVDRLLIELEQELFNGDRKPKTWEQDKVYFKMIKSLFGDLYLDEIDETWWDNWVRTEGRRLNRTLFDLAKKLSKLLTYAWMNKWIMRKPKIRNPDQKKRLGTPHIYSQDEIQRIAEKCDLELQTQLALASNCGNRTGEVRTLEWSMIEWKTVNKKRVAIVTFPIDKAGARRGEGRQFMTNPFVSEYLSRWKQQQAVKSRFVFPRPTDPNKPQTEVYQNRKWRKAVKASGIKGRAWFYDLRHTFYTTALLDAREPVQHVSEYGGTSIRTLQKRYLKSDATKTASVSKAVGFSFGEEE